jgi:hypothetical protein
MAARKPDEATEIEMQEFHVYNPLNFAAMMMEIVSSEPCLGEILVAGDLRLPEDDTYLTTLITSRIFENCNQNVREEEEFNREQLQKQKEKKKQQKKLKKKSKQTQSL